ncbi:MAG TPA: cyclic nucleotide-binding domain-containing protein, partial [Gemmatimonadales bacterium]
MPDPLGHAAYAQQVLSSTALFGALGPDALASVMGELEPRSLEGGEVLFRRGDPGDALYVVLSGRLRVERTDRGRERVVREVGRGESVGELALLTGASRSASARAVRDTELLRLSRERFDALVRAHPLVAMALTRMLAAWLATPGGAEGTAAGVSTVALLAASAEAPVSRVARSLAAALAAVGPTARLDVSTL